MKNKNSIKLGLVLLKLYFLPVLAQTDDCLIYEKILINLNVKKGEIKYHYVHPFDSVTNYMGIKERVQGKYAWNFLLVKSTFRFTPHMIRQWFANDVKDSSLKSMKFYKVKDDTIVNCQFDSTIKYQYCDYCQSADLWIDKTEIKGEDTIHYNPLLIQFSDVLYSKKGFALVFVLYTARDIRGRFEWQHCFVFQLINNEWIVIKEKKLVL